MERLSRLRTSIESLPIGSPDRRLFAALVQVLDGSLLCKTDPSRASEVLVKGISALEVVGAVVDLPRYLEMLSDVEEARGRYQEALYAARRAGALRLAAARSQSEARLRALEVRFGLDAAQRQIETERSRAHFIDKQRVVLLDETVRLTAATRTDALTGLGNRRLLDELATSLAAPSAMGELAAVAVLDLDHFKAINDRFTHAVGDRVLVEVAKIFRDCCRPKDAVVRLGGEEFAVILMDMSERKAYAVCDRLRATVASYDGREFKRGFRSPSASAWLKPACPSILIASSRKRMGVSMPPSVPAVTGSGQLPRRCCLSADHLAWLSGYEHS